MGLVPTGIGLGLICLLIAYKSEDRDTRIGFLVCAAINFAGAAWLFYAGDPCAFQACDFPDDDPAYFRE